MELTLTVKADYSLQSIGCYLMENFDTFKGFINFNELNMVIDPDKAKTILDCLVEYERVQTNKHMVVQKEVYIIMGYLIKETQATQTFTSRFAASLKKNTEDLGLTSKTNDLNGFTYGEIQRDTISDIRSAKNPNLGSSDE